MRVFASIGGDGSYIGLCRALAGVRGACVFGIHTGHLGFLTDVNPQDLREFVGELVRGEFERKWLALLGVRICGDFRADFDGQNGGGSGEFVAQNATKNPAQTAPKIKFSAGENAAKNGENSRENPAQTAPKFEFDNGKNVAPNALEFAAVNDIVISRQSSQSIITINAFLDETPRNFAQTAPKFEFDDPAPQNPAQNLAENSAQNSAQPPPQPQQPQTPPQTPAQPRAHRALRHFNTYRGDGLIVSTATGSTAYNLSAGGAILHGDVRAFCVTPICSHSLTQRPLVLPTDIALALRCAGACVVIDGQRSLALADGWVEVGFGAGRGVWLIHRKKRDYFSVLKEKLRWGSDD